MSHAFSQNRPVRFKVQVRSRASHPLRWAGYVLGRIGGTLVAAMHKSRGRQAVRFLHEHRHLISEE